MSRNGLHPFATHQLAALLRRAARDRRVVAATQSVTMLEQSGAEDVAIVEWTTSGTQMQRPNPAELTEWLSEVFCWRTLGEDFAGRPASPW
jgi:predicted ATPase